MPRSPGVRGVGWLRDPSCQKRTEPCTEPSALPGQPVVSGYRAAGTALGIPVTRDKEGTGRGEGSLTTEDCWVWPQPDFQAAEAPCRPPGLHPGPAAQRDPQETGEEEGPGGQPGWKRRQPPPALPQTPSNAKLGAGSPASAWTLHGLRGPGASAQWRVGTETCPAGLRTPFG